MHRQKTWTSTWLDSRKSTNEYSRKFRPRYHLNIVPEPSQWYVRISNTESMYTKHVINVQQWWISRHSSDALWTMVSYKDTNICHCDILPWKWYAQSNIMKILI